MKRPGIFSNNRGGDVHVINRIESIRHADLRPKKDEILRSWKSGARHSKGFRQPRFSSTAFAKFLAGSIVVFHQV